MYDIIVIGGGPAGLSAAVQARSRNRSVLIISGQERDVPLSQAGRVNNYLGMPGLSGRELIARFSTHAAQLGAERMEGRALSAMATSGRFLVAVGSEVAEGRALILATGVAHGPKYPGESEFLGRGVSYCATCDGMLYRGKPVVVVGASAQAPEEANFLQELGCQVTYVSRTRPEALQPSIDFVSAVRLEIVGDQQAAALRADGREIPCACVFLLRPSMAPADLMPGLALSGPYLQVDRDMATNLPGVFAAGDCTGLPLQISKAVGEGLIAGHRACDYLGNPLPPVSNIC